MQNSNSIGGLTCILLHDFISKIRPLQRLSTMTMRIFLFLLCALGSPVLSESFLDKANEGSSALFDRLDQEQREAAEAMRDRDRSKDVCYQLPSGSDMQTACLGDYPYAVQNERARNLLLGNCFNMGSSTELSNDLSYVCERGPSACSVFDDGDAAYWCNECDASSRWLAVYSYGRIIQCFK